MGFVGGGVGGELGVPGASSRRTMLGCCGVWVRWLMFVGDKGSRDCVIAVAAATISARIT